MVPGSYLVLRWWWGGFGAALAADPDGLTYCAGLHPATMTGILDRLERGGWIDRSRDPADRRGVLVQAARGRGAEVLRLYLVDSGMNTAMDEICADYADKDLELVAGFLRRTADASRAAAEKLTSARLRPWAGANSAVPNAITSRAWPGCPAHRPRAAAW